MRCDRATKHFEFDEALCIHRKNLGDSQVSIVAADYHVSTGNGYEPCTRVDKSSPQPTISGHVHEVNCDVITR